MRNREQAELFGIAAIFHVASNGEFTFFPIKVGLTHRFQSNRAIVWYETRNQYGEDGTMTKILKSLLGKRREPTPEEVEALSRATQTLQWRVEQMSKKAQGFRQAA